VKQMIHICQSANVRGFDEMRPNNPPSLNASGTIYVIFPGFAPFSAPLEAGNYTMEQFLQTATNFMNQWLSKHGKNELVRDSTTIIDRYEKAIRNYTTEELSLFMRVTGILETSPNCWAPILTFCT
jgi:hypothetical protein